MTVPVRRATPALLQIDAIVLRLPGLQALAEVARFLTAEFDSYREVAFYRREGGVLRRVAASDAPALDETIGLGVGVVGRAAVGGEVPAPTPQDTELAVPIGRGPEPSGALAVVARDPGRLDRGDLSFLRAAAAKLDRPLTEGAVLKTL